MKIRENVQLSDKTTMRVGGPARYFVSVTSVEELKEAVQFAKESNLSLFVLGGGSNVLVSDDGFLGVVISMNTKGVIYDGTTVTAQAGEEWDHFVSDTLEHHLYGLENLSYIPGTVGASPIQNIGAYGREVSGYISHVEVLNIETLEIETLENNECGFSYRDSLFKKTQKYIIVSVSFKLSDKPTVDISYKDLEQFFGSVTNPTPQEVREAVIEIRKNKLPDPKSVGTVGSFFKNPIITTEAYKILQETYSELPSYKVDDDYVKIPLAWILDNVLHLKGFQKGNVKLHDTQPLAIVNVGGATEKEIEMFAEFISKKVFDVTEIEIENEVRTIK